MDGAGPTVFERIEQKLSKMGIAVDNSDIREASRQVEAKLEVNPDDTESKIHRLELKVVELARLLDAAIGMQEHEAAPAARIAPKAAEHTEEEIEHAEPVEHAPPQAARKVKRMLQNPATGIIEEVEVEDRPQDHFIVADGRGGALPGKRLASNDDGPKGRKKPMFIAAKDDEPVSAADQQMGKRK